MSVLIKIIGEFVAFVALWALIIHLIKVPQNLELWRFVVATVLLIPYALVLTWKDVFGGNLFDSVGKSFMQLGALIVIWVTITFFLKTPANLELWRALVAGVLLVPLSHLLLYNPES